jgi:endonuclease I
MAGMPYGLYVVSLLFLKMMLMKKLLVLTIVMFSVRTLFAQTALPATWDCTAGTLPAFWTSNSASYYTSSSYIHSAPNALKFDFSGAFLKVFFSDDPDTLTYYLRGSSFSGGTFLVQQSVDSIVWTTLRSFTDANIPNTSLSGAAPYKEVLNATTRYVRFIYTVKSSGNVSLDDITIGKRAPGPLAEIAIKVNQQLMQSGLTAVTGNLSSIPCMIYNSGTDSVLRISASSFSGTDAAMFSLSGLPAQVPAHDSAAFTINFTPTGVDGTKTATLSLSNNDSDENPYLIQLWAVKGCCATEPAYNAVNFSVLQIKSYSVQLSFSNGVTLPERYIVLKKTSPVTEVPADGQTYIKGSYVGNAQVCYSGPAGSFIPSDIVAGTNYYFKVFPVNGYPGYENYLTSNPASVTASTLVNMIGNYYDGINSSSPSFRDDLHTLINNHTTQFYSDYGPTVLHTMYYRDTTENGQWRKMVRCAYSNMPYVYADPFSWTVLSREHNFCQSWMPTYSDPNFTNLPEYSDYHNLIPVNQNNVNSYRNNYPLGEVTTPTYSYGQCTMGTNALGQTVFEPRDEVKGDAARAQLYMILCYDGISGNNWFMPDTIAGLGYGEDLALMISWCHADPPDAFEMAKNDYIYSMQGNRNPFVDSVQWVDLIDFTATAGIANHQSESGLRIFPNPAGEYFFIKSTVNTGKEMQFTMYDAYGREVLKQQIPQNSGIIKIDRKSLPAGIYSYSAQDEGYGISSGTIILL